MAENETEKSEDWRNEVSEEGSTTLKIADGESKEFKFLTDGEKKDHADYGTSILFKVLHEKVEKNFHVRKSNFSFLLEIKKLGDLVNKVVKVSRVGSKKSDTRYSIELVTLPEKDIKED